MASVNQTEVSHPVPTVVRVPALNEYGGILYETDVEQTVELYNGRRAIKNSPNVMHTLEDEYFLKGDGNFAYDNYGGGYRYVDDMLHGFVNENGEVGYFYESAPYVYYEPEEEYYMTGSIARALGLWRCDGCGEWNHESNDCYCDNETGSSHIAGYHNLERIDKRSDGWKYAVGIEIEKEDSSVLSQLDWRSIHKHWGWCIEQDGSLDDDGGFEAVSPIFNLFDTEMLDKHFTQFKNIINAEYTSNCGGHIHISAKDIGAYDLFDKLAPYYPLLFSLYPSRINRNYSQANDKERMKDAGKYSSVARHHYTVEFRIFPSPKSVATLYWRLDLLRLMVTTPVSSYEEVVDLLLNTNSLFFKHLAKVFTTPERYISKVRQTIDFCKQFENVDIARATEMLSLEKQLQKIMKKARKKKEDTK